MTWGESWEANFNVAVNALPSSNLPLIECATPICHAAGLPISSGGQTSDVRFRLQYFGPYVDLGFSPLAVRVLNLYAPGGTLTQTPSSGVAPLSVTYSFGIGGGIPPYRFSWLFGDGTSGLTTSPTTTHSFASSGKFTTVLLFEDAQGREFAATTVERVFAPLSVHASVLPKTGGPLSADVQASIQGGAAQYDVYWNSSGRYFLQVLTTPGLSHVEFSYDQPGNYSVELRVHDASGQVGTASLVVEVARSRSVPLSVSVHLLGFEQSSSTACGPYDGTARLLGTANGGIAPYNFSWSFGDGRQGGGVAPNHTYLSPGRYEVRLLVVDSGGITTPGGINLTIAPAPSTCPTVSGGSGTGPTLVLGLVSALAIGVTAIGWLAFRARSGSRRAARREPA
ncbi:MAG TPA: PKD domain-containing protein [Thermoplasmata archaeon]|nr:PKD domain-containing protein [Thermoplasmata archaeon]